MAVTDVNLLAVLGGAIAGMIIGAVWYGPLFGKKWMALMGKSEAELKKGNMSLAMGATFVGLLIMSFVLGMMANLFAATSILDGVIVALWAFVGFVLTTHTTNALFGGKNLSLHALDVGHWLVVMLAIGIVHVLVV